MSKTVIIVEKPSMKKKYEEALKGFADVSCAASVGHIEELQPPEYYVGKEKIYWSELLEHFPLIPEKFELKITNKEVYERIKSAVKNAEEIILACDPDREGEYIHRNILDMLTKEEVISPKKITRVWLNAETTGGIREAFEKRKDYIEYEGYYKAARIRNIIDWITGIQLTVLYSVRFGKPGFPISIGRVQSWLLAEIVRRTEQNTNFVPRDYWTIQFVTEEAIKLNMLTEEEKVKQIDDEEEFNKIISEITDKELTITSIDKKPFTEYAPSLYDLSALQKDAAKQFSITPEKTLELAQKLYEDYHLISYPRTDCNIISEEEAKELKKSLDLVGKFPEYKDYYDAVIKENPKVTINKKYIGKIKGHFAIIPVFNYDKQNAPNLREEEKKIFDLIVKRFVAALLPPVKGDKTKIRGTIEKHLFGTEIKNIKDFGYKKYFKNDDKEESDVVSIKYNVGDKKSGKLETKKDKTKPEALHKDESIMALMEKAHLSIKNEELRNKLKEANGIGTAATRASFIPILIKRGYILKEKGNYIPTEKGYDVYKVLPEELKYADYSAKLEHEMALLIEGQGRAEAEIISETKEYITSIFNKLSTSVYDFKEKSYGKCPKCASDVVNRKFAYECITKKRGACDFNISKEIAKKQIEENDVIRLLENRKTPFLTGFTSKEGKNFDAHLKIDSTNKVVFDFNDEEKYKRICPACKKGEIVEGRTGYGCNKWNDGCRFLILKEIAGKKLTSKNIFDLVKKGKTELIKGFKDKEEKEFDAHLILVDNKVDFEYTNNVL